MYTSISGLAAEYTLVRWTDPEVCTHAHIYTYMYTCVHIYIVKVLLGKRHTWKLLVAWKLRTLYVTSWELDGESDPQVILFVFLNIMSVTLINLF